MDIYAISTPDQVKPIVDSCTWIHKKDIKYRDMNNDGKSVFLNHFYSGKQYFGCTDYKDHRKDTVKKLKNLVYDGMINNGHQLLHFYKDRIKMVPYTTIIVDGYLGGYTAYFI